jgi:FG-GAP-like repeat
MIVRAMIFACGGAIAVCLSFGAAGGTVDSSIDASRMTNWNPGILSDTTGAALGLDNVPVRTTICATLSPSGSDDTANIQTALNNTACQNKVVLMNPGKFNISSPLTVPSYVVLRGSGSGPGGTTVYQNSDNTVIAIGAWGPGQPINDGACYGGGYGTVANVTANAVKESSQIQVSAADAKTIGASLPALAIIDEVDDNVTVLNNGGSGMRRTTTRSTGQRILITAANATTGILTLGSPLHWTFRSASPYLAQVAIVNTGVTVYAGIENMLVEGGSNLSGYNGQRAGGIELSNAAYSWVKNIRTDATIMGVHIEVTGGFRDVVRDSEARESRITYYAEDSYGIVLRCATADTLVENNISHYMNKPFLFMTSGGGNVVAYNYFDNAWATDYYTGDYTVDNENNKGTFQESALDSHNVFSHMELVEGNYVSHIAITATHGNAGYITFFRNYASSQFASPWTIDHVPGYTFSHDATNSPIESANIESIGFQSGMIDMNVVGNVFGSSAKSNIGTSIVTSVFRTESPGGIATIWDLPTSNTDVTLTSLWAHGNWDTIDNQTMYYNGSLGGNSGNSAVRAFPSSLYLNGRPGWWPSTSKWPWAGPDLPLNSVGIPIDTLPAMPKTLEANTHDFNGDGYSDIAWRDNSGNIAFWLMNGAAVSSTGGVSGLPSTWSIVGQRDFNGDGTADLFWLDTTGDIVMWFMNGAAVNSTTVVAQIPTNWSVAGVADFNGDGLGDILWRDTSGNLAVWLMNGATPMTLAGLGNVPTNWNVVGTGDFNGDGKTDLLWQDNLGNTSIWFMNGTAVASAAGVGNIPTSWSVVGTGDFNADGMTDIVWRDTAGDTSIWLMNGAAILSAAGLANVPIAWSIALVGDYNGDGLSDLLWRDTSGNTAIWFMNGAVVSSTAGVGIIPTNWTVQSVNAE